METYKTVGGVKLNAYVYEPAGHQASDRRPAIVFFFGGGWTGGSPSQFQHQCAYLATRGLVAITADYRVASRQPVKAVDCVRDAKSAIRWVRQNAARLGIDPDRIAAGGGSAGGHLAACTGVIADLDEAGEDRNVSSRPNALVLYNPALVLAPYDGQTHERFVTGELANRLGIEPTRLSPIHHVRTGAPPTIVFHGQADTTVPYATAEAFATAMQKAGNRCELVGAAGQPHGYFNYGRGNQSHFLDTLRATDRFLVSLGWLKGPDTVEAFFRTPPAKRS